MYNLLAKMEFANFEDLAGKTLAQVDVNWDYDYIKFVTTEGETFLMYHKQECCESVSIESIEGEMNNLLNHPILLAEEVTESGKIDDEDEWDGTQTWTFYKLATIKGYVDIRWNGSSNGFYSESVSFVKLLQ